MVCCLGCFKQMLGYPWLMLGHIHGFVLLLTTNAATKEPPKMADGGVCYTPEMVHCVFCKHPALKLLTYCDALVLGTSPVGMGGYRRFVA